MCGDEGVNATTWIGCPSIGTMQQSQLHIHHNHRRPNGTTDDNAASFFKLQYNHPPLHQG